jgi:hypothetical protein
MSPIAIARRSAATALGDTLHDLDSGVRGAAMAQLHPGGRGATTKRRRRQTKFVRALMPARIFISYSRKDGAACAADLRKKLLKKDPSVWQDITALEGGRDWWSQIEEVMRSKALQHFVFIVTPTALASPVVRQEIRLARQEGKTVSPIKGPGLGELGKLPRWVGQVYDLELTEHFTTLIRVLQDQSLQRAMRESG